MGIEEYRDGLGYKFSLTDIAAPGRVTRIMKLGAIALIGNSGNILDSIMRKFSTENLKLFMILDCMHSFTPMQFSSN